MHCARLTVTTPRFTGVVVEAPIGAEGIDSDTLADVSRAISKTLDVADPIDGEYLLEVSTPGAERELTKVGHWMRQVGRLVRIKLRAGGYVSGRVVAADETRVTIDVDGESRVINYQDIRKARARIDFGSEK